MHEKLIEAWIDSASERSYQPAFCSMLARQGYRVRHSTRHAPTEFGKDVLAIDTKGKPCAFQLKGNPGGRLTGSQFAGLIEQINQLVYLQVPFPDLSKRYSRPFLVTNGRVDEEALLQVKLYNETLKNRRMPYPLQVIARDEMLQWALELGGALWPSELTDIDALLKLMVADGRAMPDLSRLTQLIRETLQLDDSAKPPKRPELQRRFHSAALLTSLAIKPHSLAENHTAEVVAWSLYACHCICALDRSGLTESSARSSLEMADAAIAAALGRLAEECTGTEVPMVGNFLEDHPLIQPRATLLTALLCVYWLWDERSGRSLMDSGNRAAVEQTIAAWSDHLMLWGEGAVPQFLAIYWYLCSRPSRKAADNHLSRLLSTIVSRSNDAMGMGLPSPYYTVEDVVRRAYGIRRGGDDDFIFVEDCRDSSSTAESVFTLLVRANLRTTCKRIWPEYSRIHRVRVVLDEASSLSKWRADDAEYQSAFTPPRVTWNGLITNAKDLSAPGVPAALRERPILLLLLVLFLPHRASVDIVKLLDAKLVGSEFI